MSGLAQQYQAERMVDLGIGDHDAFDRYMPNRERDVFSPQTLKLLADIGGCIEEEPTAPVDANGG